MDSWTQYEWALENTRTMFVSGGPGLGKTYGAYHNKIEGRSLYAMTLGEESSSAEVRGHWISKGSEKGTVWHDGPLSSAIRESRSRFVVNEISNASPDVLGMLYAVLEDPSTAKLTLPTGETLEVGEGFQCVFTDNYEADRALTPALKDRIEAFITCTSPHPEALKQVAEPLREYAENAVTSGVSGLRAWHHLSKFLASGMDTEDAVQMAFGQVNEVLSALTAEAMDSWRTSDHREDPASSEPLPLGPEDLRIPVKPSSVAPKSDVPF